MKEHFPSVLPKVGAFNSELLITFETKPGSVGFGSLETQPAMHSPHTRHFLVGYGFSELTAPSLP
jgi:hypothetical protein